MYKVEILDRTVIGAIVTLTMEKKAALNAREDRRRLAAIERGLLGVREHIIASSLVDPNGDRDGSIRADGRQNPDASAESWLLGRQLEYGARTTPHNPPGRSLQDGSRNSHGPVSVTNADFPTGRIFTPTEYRAYREAKKVPDVPF